MATHTTTRIREEPYQADVIKKYGVRAVIGKAGMGAKTVAALKEAGAVYLNGIDGAAQYLRPHGREGSQRPLVGIRHSGSDVAIAGERFRCQLTTDAHGNSLHTDVEKATGEVPETLKA